MKLIVPAAPPPQPETLTKDLVQHLSKEIETTTNNMMVFRSRIGFSLCIGPFLLLGSLIVGAKGQSVASNFKWYGWVALGVVIICYLGIAYITSEIELQSLEQCNRWRRVIRDICKTPSTNVKKSKVVPTLFWGCPIFGRKRNGVKIAYFVGYSLLFVAVIAAVVIVRAGSPDPANYPTNPATLRLEGTTLRVELVTPTPSPTPTRQLSGDENNALPKTSPPAQESPQNPD